MAQKQQPIEMITPPNMLRVKVGGRIGPVDEAAIQRAEQALEDMKEVFSDWLETEVDKLEIAAGRVWVAAQGEALLGLLNLSLTQPHAHLMNVAVSLKAKGQGVGGALIRHAVALAEGAGCTALDLATHRDLTDNISLYQHLGWEIMGRKDRRVMMRLTLDRGV